MPTPKQEQHECDNNNTEMRAGSTEQPVSNANEFVVIDLITQNADMDNAPDVNNNSNNPNVANDIRSLTAAVAVDSRATNNVDEVLILNYEHNTDARVDNEVMHFNGIHIRNNNSCIRNGMNSVVSEQTRPDRLALPYGGISDNARSGIFQPSVSAINGSGLMMCHDELPLVVNAVHNSEAEVNGVDGVEEQELEFGDGVGGESTHLLFAQQYGAMTTPIHRQLGSVNSALIQISAADIGRELVEHEYLQQQQTQHNSRSRRRRRRRGRRGHGGRQQQNQIRRSLKSMNIILRKTVNTLRRIKSLIMQQVQMARDHLNLPMT